MQRSQDVLCRHMSTRDCVVRLQRIVLQASASPRYVCDTCGEHFALREFLMRHVLLHSGPTSAVRDVTSESSSKQVFVEPSVFNRTVTVDKSHTSSDASCADKRPMLNEIACDENRDSRDNNRFVCDVCEMKFVLKRDLKSHLLSKASYCSRVFTCDVASCKKRFRTKRGVKKHKYTHSDDRPFICTVANCGKSYKGRHALACHHEVVHSGKKRRLYVCRVAKCKKTFTTIGGHKGHRLRFHSDTKSFACSFVACGKCFKTQNELNTHARIHSAETPFVCSVESCRKRFKTNNSLYSHKTIHSSVTPIVCGKCNQGFKSKEYFDRHKTVHLGKKSYACDVSLCEKRFKTKLGLQLHKTLHAVI